MERELKGKESEYAAGLAAAAFAIKSLEEKYEWRMMSSDDPSKRKRILSSRSGTNHPSFDLSTTTLSKRKPSSSSSSSPNARIIEEAPSWSQRRGISTADAWERDQLQKIDNRYKKMRSTIAEWETKKQMKAKVQMEKRKAEIEKQKTLLLLDYDKKTGWIHSVSKRALVQLLDKKRKDESLIKQKSKQPLNYSFFCVKYC